MREIVVMRKLFVAGCVLGLLAVVAVGVQGAGAKISIKNVMKTCMKGGLLKKVIDADASDAEKTKLVEQFEALAANKPSKGDEASWQEKTTALVAGAQEAAAGKGTDKLKAASNCKACHSVHKG
jgi:hypothetical protein